MENIELLSAFYKHRGFKRRLLEGFRFLERNFTALFRVSSFVLIPFALAAALCVVWLTAEAYDAVSTVVSGQSPLQLLGGMIGSVAVSGLVLLAGTCCWKALEFNLFRSYIEYGYVPSRSAGSWMSISARDVWRFFLFVLFCAFFWALFGAVAYMLVVLSVWLLVVLVPAWIYCGVIFLLFPYYYMIERESLWDAFLHAFRRVTPTWGTTFGLVLLCGIVIGMFLFVVFLPALLTLLTDVAAAKAVLDGNMPDLPSYYSVLQVVLWFVGIWLGLMAILAFDAPLLFHYGALMAKDKEAMLAAARAEEERLKAERARLAAAKEREAAYRDGSAFRPW